MEKRSAWATPFGLAFIVGTAAALVAGYYTGAGMRGGDFGNIATTDINLSDNLAEAYPDENALIAANREPAPAPVAATPPPAPEQNVATPAPAETAPTEVRRPRDRSEAEPPPEEAPQDEPDGNR